MKNQEALGQRLLWMKKDFPEQPMSDLADILFIQIRDGYDHLPSNPKHETLGTHTAEVYKAELRAQAEAGERNAKIMLEALERGEHPPEDPGGN